MADGNVVENKYRSRKFLVTVGGTILAVVMAYFGKLSPELSNVILAAMASYNISNAWIQRKN